MAGLVCRHYDPALHIGNDNPEHVLRLIGNYPDMIMSRYRSDGYEIMLFLQSGYGFGYAVQDKFIFSNNIFVMGIRQEIFCCAANRTNNFAAPAGR